MQAYAILLDGLCKNQQLSMAIELVREMDNKLDQNILMEGLFLAGDVESVVYHPSDFNLMPVHITY